MDTAKMIQGLAYARDLLNTIPVTGAENCQKVINIVLNMNGVISELTKELGKDQPNENNE